MLVDTAGTKTSGCQFSHSRYKGISDGYGTTTCEPVPGTENAVYAIVRAVMIVKFGCRFASMIILMLIEMPFLCAQFMSYPAADAATGKHSLVLSKPVGVLGTTKVQLLGFDELLSWGPIIGGSGMHISLPPPPLGSAHAWTLKLTDLKNAA